MMEKPKHPTEVNLEYTLRRGTMKTRGEGNFDNLGRTKIIIPKEQSSEIKKGKKKI